MKNLLLASMVLSGTVAYSQAGLPAQSDNYGSKEIAYTLNDVVVSNSIIMLGDADAKSKKGRTINGDGRTAYYFGNPEKQEGLYLNSVLFKVQKVKYKTEARIRLYGKREYVQDAYHPKTGVKNSYNSFIPGEQVTTDEIVVFLEPGQKGVIEIDVSQYDITMPAEGLFVSLEGVGYYDANGKSLHQLDSKDMTWIEFHPAVDDNFCEWTHPRGSDSKFWMNVNKWLRNDYEFAFETDVPKKVLKVPNFGLKVERR